MELAKIIQYYRQRDHLSLEAIGNYVGVAKSTVQRWVSGESKHITEQKLEKLSMLFQIDMQSFLHGQSKPILGFVKAGYDLWNDQQILGYEEVSKKEAQQGDYFLQVQGDSMNGSRINDQDLVYVKSTSQVNHLDIVIALIEHEEVTIKKYLKTKEAIILMPSNPAYEPRIFNPQAIMEGKLIILGKVLFSKIKF